MSADYLVWSYCHGAWWGPKRSGYTMNPNMAGRYTKEEADAICRMRTGPNAPYERAVHVSEVDFGESVEQMRARLQAAAAMLREAQDIIHRLNATFVPSTDGACGEAAAMCRRIDTFLNGGAQ